MIVGEKMQKKKEKIFIILFCAFMGTVCIMVNSMNSFLYKFTENNDAHCFVTTVRCMFRGDVLYKDVYEHKGPLLYFLYALGFWIYPKSFAGIAAVEAVFYSVYVFFAYKITELFVDKKVFRYLITLCTAWISSSDIAFDGGGQCEELTLPFLCITMYIVLKYYKKEYPNKIKARDVILIGMCFAFTFWIKYTLTGLYLGLVILIVVYQVKDKTAKNLGFYILEFIAGFCIGSLPVIVYFAINSGFADLIHVYFYNLIFVYSQNGREKLHLLDYFLKKDYLMNHLWNTMCYLVTIAYCVARRNKHYNLNLRIVTLTMIFSQILGISTTYYYYYLAQATCVFAVFGVLTVYFVVYDIRDYFVICYKKIVSLSDKILSLNYRDLGEWILYGIVIILLVAFQPVFVFSEIVYGIIFARALKKAEINLAKKNKYGLFLKYLPLVGLLFLKYEILRRTVHVAIVLFLLSDTFKYRKQICQYGQKLLSYIQSNVKSYVIKFLGCVFGAIVIILVTLNVSPYSKFMTEDVEFYPQYRIADYINESGIEDPQIIYWGCFDLGVYWLTDTYPPYKYFCFYNLESEYIPKLFKEGMDSGKIDFVVSVEEVTDDNYELVYYGEREYRDQKIKKYYLYERKDRIQQESGNGK